jgi:hypothetical protein
MTGIVEVSGSVPNDNTGRMAGYRVQISVGHLGSPQKQATLTRCKAGDRSRSNGAKEYERRA